jgi:hypothetical protein
MNYVIRILKVIITDEVVLVTTVWICIWEVLSSNLAWNTKFRDKICIRSKLHRTIELQFTVGKWRRRDSNWMLCIR